MSTGRIYLVGAGPGDPGLITVRGLRLLAEADVVVYDYLVSPRLLDHVRDGAERIYVGKKAGEHTLPQEAINELLIEKARGGANVVRLKGGDPFVFGRGGEEALSAVEAGIDWEVVPGVTAGVGGLAYAGIPATHRGLAGNVALITGHETPDKGAPTLDYQVLARWGGTLVFSLGLVNLRRICAALIAGGLDPATPVALVRWAATPDQQVVTGTAATIDAIAKEAKITPPALIVVGDVVGLREKLCWFERRPLFGQRIVVTRARPQASKFTALLTELGADVIETPTIRIAAADDGGPLLQKAIADLPGYDWIVFTSANAVERFFGGLHEAAMDSRALHANNICAIGPVTAERLAEYGIEADCLPDKALGSAVAAAMANVEDLSGKRVLCPRSDRATADLIDTLTAAGAAADHVTAYRTVSDCTNIEQVTDLLADGRLHWITFTSSSTVTTFFDAIDPAVVGGCETVRLASIGPVTSAALGRLGLAPEVEARSHTTEGLADAIAEAVRGGPS